MTIAYPRDLPDPLRFRAATFELRHTQAKALARGGQPQVVNIARPLWDIRYETYLLGEAQVAAWEAWTASLRGGARLFKAWSPLRRYALGYASGYGGMTRGSGGSFDGTATLASIGVALDTMTLAGLPAGFVLAPGDMISFAHSASSQALHRVIEGATASAGGGATVTVEPELRPSPPSNATVALAKPWCNAVLDAASLQIRWQSDRRAAVSFSATQVL